MGARLAEGVGGSLDPLELIAAASLLEVVLLN